MELPNLTGKKRFSLRSLILTMTAACFLLGAWSVYLNPYRQQAKSLALVTQLQGGASEQAAEGPAWQRWLVETILGKDSFAWVTVVDLSGRNVDDDALSDLAGLKHLVDLNLDSTQISDAGMPALESFPALQKLSLRFTKISDKSATHLSALPQLKQLYLTSTQLTDASTDDLVKLAALEELFVRWSHISDGGAEKLRQALPNCKVYNNSLVTDVAAGP